MGICLDRLLQYLRRMQVLLRAAFHISCLRGNDIVRVAIIVDSDTGIRADTVIALLHPWRSWLEITDVFVASSGSEDGWIVNATANGVRAISIVSERPEFISPIEEAASQRGLQILHSDYSTDSERAAALLHEMSHHHFEIGGFNEWDGSMVLYAPYVLQHISAANCIRHFPQYTIDDLRTCHSVLGRPIEALDIGSGPISRLRWGALSGLLHVTGVDPLLDIYDILLTHHGLNQLPSIKVDRAITARAEDLECHVTAGSFDFAFCCNALDHVEDPQAVIVQLARALRPGAQFALEFATREGSRQEWRQLHQFDLFLDANHGELMCQWRDGRLDVLVPKGTPLVLSRVVTASDDYTAVILRHYEHRLSWRTGWGFAHRLAKTDPPHTG
jgi:SAM-dependent methyltransferase